MLNLNIRVFEIRGFCILPINCELRGPPVQDKKQQQTETERKRLVRIGSDLKRQIEAEQQRLIAVGEF